MSPMAVALPVVVGMSERPVARARRRSLCGASMIVCVLVASWTVVIALVDDLHDGREAVGRAGRVGQQAMLRGVVEVIVDAHDDVERIAALHGRGHDDLLYALVEVGRELFGRAEFAAAFEHDVHAVRGPIHVGELGVFGEGDAFLADADRVLALGDGLLGPTALHGVEGEKVRGALGAALRVVDDGDLKFGPAPGGAESEAADAAETIDANADFFHADGRSRGKGINRWTGVGGVEVWRSTSGRLRPGKRARA
jgi:hypothetical protein